MAKVVLEPIGATRDEGLSEEAYGEQLAAMEQRKGELLGKRAKVRDGWGPKYHERVRAKGKLPTWDRIDRLRDPGSPIWPIGTLVNDGREFGADKRTSPGAGVVTAFVIAGSGAADPRGWHRVVYNVSDVYRDTFGGNPGDRPLGIGVLSDANNTSSYAAADYDDFVVFKNAANASRVEEILALEN